MRCSSVEIGLPFRLPTTGTTAAMPNQLPHPLSGVVRYSTPPAMSDDLFEQLLHSTPMLTIAEEIAASLEVEESMNRLRTMAWAEWKVVSLLSKKAKPDPFVDALIATIKARVEFGQKALALLDLHGDAIRAHPGMLEEALAELSSDVEEASTHIDRIRTQLESA